MGIHDAEGLVKEVRDVFQESQATVATHKRLQLKIVSILKRAIELELENVFSTVFIKMIGLILPCKKGYLPANRVISFIAPFIDQISKEDEFKSFYPTFIDALFNFLLQGFDSRNASVRYRTCHIFGYIIFALPEGGPLKYEQEEDEDDEEGHSYLEILGSKLTIRVFDINADVKIRAIKVYANFQNEDYLQLSDAGRKIRSIMRNDERSEVRRQCLVVLEKNAVTENDIIERARDVDPLTRKTLYNKVLPAYKSIKSISRKNRVKLLLWGLRDRDEGVRDACTQWIMKNWIKDCDDNIDKFVTALYGRQDDGEEEEEENDDDRDETNTILNNDIGHLVLTTIFEADRKHVTEYHFDESFFDNLDVSSSLLTCAYFDYCKGKNLMDLIDNNFPMASKFADIVKNAIDKRLENKILVEQTTKNHTGDEIINGEELGLVDPDDCDFIVAQLLRMAVDYDYSDEFGRSKLYNILRDTLCNMHKHEFSDPLLDKLMECLSKLAISERDFCQVVIEIVNDIKDNIYDDVISSKAEKERIERKKEKKRKRHTSADYEEDENDSSDNEEKGTKSGNDSEDSDSDEYHSAIGDISRQSALEADKSRQEEINQVVQLDAQSLTLLLNITKFMLRLTFRPLSEHVSVVSFHNSFILQCLNKRTEIPVRLLALECHGLCGLLDKNVACNVMRVAAVFAFKADSAQLIECGIKVMCDLLAAHGTSIVLGTQDDEIQIDAGVVAKILYRTLNNEDYPDVQPVVAEGLYKLFLGNTIDDEQLFEMTILKYFDSRILNNNKLRQCLEYCIPAYCFSSVSHQELMTRVAGDVITRLLKTWDDITSCNTKPWASKRPTTVKLIVEKLSEWTCPWNIISLPNESIAKIPHHLDYAIELLKLMRQFDPSKPDEKKFYKPLVLQLSQLTLTPEIGLSKLVGLKNELCSPQLFQGQIIKVFDDKTCSNSFSKILEFTNQCIQQAEELEGKKESDINLEEYRSRHSDEEEFSANQDESSSHTGPVSVSGTKTPNDIKPASAKADSRAGNGDDIKHEEYPESDDEAEADLEDNNPTSEPELDASLSGPEADSPSEANAAVNMKAEPTGVIVSESESEPGDDSYNRFATGSSPPPEASFTGAKRAKHKFVAPLQTSSPQDPDDSALIVLDSD